jgi:hypothetical protein
MSEEKGFLDHMFEEEEKENPVWRFLTTIFWYRTIRRIPDVLRSVKWFFQRIVRSHHSSDCDLWGLDNHLTPIIFKKLVAFRKQPLHGYPSCLSEYFENEWESKEKYDEAVTKGEMLGGGFEAWLKILDEMIFAFEFLTYYEASDKKRDKMLAKYGLEYPHQKKPENKSISYSYRLPTGDFMSSHLPPDDPENAKNKFLGESASYYNFNLEREYYERVQKGLNLFAKHFMSLWD